MLLGVQSGQKCSAQQHTSSTQPHANLDNSVHSSLINDNGIHLNISYAIGDTVSILKSIYMLLGCTNSYLQSSIPFIHRYNMKFHHVNLKLSKVQRKQNHRMGQLLALEILTVVVFVMPAPLYAASPAHSSSLDCTSILPRTVAWLENP